jgi:hypothetical protein
MADNTVTYRATSAFTDPITVINALSLVLLAEDVRNIISPRWLPYVAALIAVLNIVLQLAPIADRPVRLNVVPGASKPIALAKLE